MSNQIANGQVRSTMECFADYAATFPKAVKGAGEARVPLAKFAGVTPDTVREWARNPKNVVGLPLIKLRYFLGFLGYRVAELKSLDPRLYQLGALIAFGQLPDINAVARDLGFADGDRIMRFLHGKRSLPQAYSERLDALLNQQKPSALDMRRSGWRTYFSVMKVPLPQERREPVVTTPPVHRKPETPINGATAVIPDQAIIEVYAHQIRAMLPLVRYLTSEHSTPEMRKQVRALVGQEMVFELSNRTNQMCGETAFKQYAPRRNGN